MTKTFTFAIMHFGIAFGVAYGLTGDILLGGSVALIEPIANTLGYHLHEKIWQRIRNQPDTGQELAALSCPDPATSP